MLSGFFFVQICSKTFKNVYYSWCIHGAKILYIAFQLGYRDFGADLVQKNAPKWLNHRSA